MQIAGFTLAEIPTHERLTHDDIYRPIVATRADGFTLQFPTLEIAQRELPRLESEDYNRTVHEYKRR